MAKFAYNNAKNASTGHTPFELNCGYHLCVFFKEDTNPRSRSKTANKLLAELQELIIICRENLHHVQKLQKRAHNKGVKPKNYVSDNKIWLNSKYIKTKQNRKLKAKFFKPFPVLYPVGKQAYKLELLKKWRIYNVFHVSLLEQNITRKERIEKVLELNAGNNSKKHKVKTIWDSTVYTMELESGYLLGFYYLVAYKDYPEEENTWEPILAVQYLRKLISLFHKDHLKKPTAISPPVNFAPPMARPTVKPTPKFTTTRKRGRLANSANKQAKKNWTFCLFPHITSLWSNQVTCLLAFHQEMSVFLLKLFHWVKRFFTVSNLSNNFSYCQFALHSSYWVKRFFYWQYLSAFFFSFFTWLESFLH